MKGALRAAAPRALLAIVACVLAGCASSPMPRIRAAYEAGDYNGAREALVELEKSDSSNAHLWAMERAMAELALHRPDVAEQLLRGSRDRLDDLAGGSALEWLSSVMLDDRQL